MEKISLAARKEMLENVKNRYKELSWNEKRKVIDGLCSATGYERKYAISILNGSIKKNKRKKGAINTQYTEDVKRALITIWEATNQICSKRLVPFIPDIIEALERHNHLQLSKSTRDKLLKVDMKSKE